MRAGAPRYPCRRRRDAARCFAWAAAAALSLCLGMGPVGEGPALAAARAAGAGPAASRRSVRAVAPLPMTLARSSVVHKPPKELLTPASISGRTTASSTRPAQAAEADAWGNALAFVGLVLLTVLVALWGQRTHGAKTRQATGARVEPEEEAARSRGRRRRRARRRVRRRQRQRRMPVRAVRKPSLTRPRPVLVVCPVAETGVAANMTGHGAPAPSVLEVRVRLGRVVRRPLVLGAAGLPGVRASGVPTHERLPLCRVVPAGKRAWAVEALSGYHVYGPDGLPVRRLPIPVNTWVRVADIRFRIVVEGAATPEGKTAADEVRDEPVAWPSAMHE